jgi:DNA repair protein RecN (Recombination protein N)
MRNRAGRSIIVDAVNLMLANDHATLVRGGAERTVVEGIFAVPGHLREELLGYLREQGLEGESPDEIVLMREVRANGRSQARVNGIMCSLNVYRDVGGMLVDIHGQGEHLSLLRPAQHLYLLDRYAGVQDKRREVRDLVHQLYQLREEINGLLVDEAALPGV